MKLRGFIYKTPEDEWILAQEPDLKSCCLGKEGQITLHGDFARCSAFKAYTVQGRLENDHLYEAQLHEKGSFPLLTLATLLFLIPIIKKFIRS